MRDPFTPHNATTCPTWQGGCNCNVSREALCDCRAKLAECERERDALRAGVVKLREALIAHRGDLHEGSLRPCPTCRQSAEALGIWALVPNSCAHELTDKPALAATADLAQPSTLAQEPPR